MIFLMATFWLVSWSRAELQPTARQQAIKGRDAESKEGQNRIPDEAESSHAHRLEIRVPVAESDPKPDVLSG